MRIAVAGATGVVGRHVVTEAMRRGHEVAPLSRTTGQDLVSKRGVAEALRGADAVVDVSSVATTNATVSTGFFRAATANLLDAGRDEGVDHHVALSIVGIDGIDAGYYAGKLAQERAVTTSDRPWSILRAGQFHEFAEQVAPQGALGPITLVPTILSRSVAAREVAAALVDAVEQGPAGRLTDLVGPDDDEVPDMVRRMLRHDGLRRPVVPLPLPGRFWRALRSGVLRGTSDARRGSVTFDAWLDSADHVPTPGHPAARP